MHPSTWQEHELCRPMKSKCLWDKNREDSAAAGVWTYAQCECVLNGGYIDGACAEMNLFKTFLAMSPPLLALRTERCIWATQRRKLLA